MNISMTSDYAADTGCPELYLKRIADTGFTHVHWCHQWNTDFQYSKEEIAQIRKWLSECNLNVTDLHGTTGKEKQWISTAEDKRTAGIELVRNRIEMAAELGTDVVIMHLPIMDTEELWDAGWKTLDELKPMCRKYGVRLAVENGFFDYLERVFSRYSENYIGLCYDSGHGNLSEDGLDRLEAVKDRLISLHMHDNNGKEDQHRLIFSGTVDWKRLARIIASSPYSKWVNLETGIRQHEDMCEEEFLRQAYKTGARFTNMIQKAADE